jgi:hypothetical protein
VTSEDETEEEFQNFASQPHLDAVWKPRNQEIFLQYETSQDSFTYKILKKNEGEYKEENVRCG